MEDFDINLDQYMKDINSDKEKILLNDDLGLSTDSSSKSINDEKQIHRHYFTNLRFSARRI